MENTIIGTQNLALFLEQAKTSIDLIFEMPAPEAWQHCEVIDAMIDYMLLSGDYSRADYAINHVRPTFGISGSDDLLWAAIAGIKAFYISGDVGYVNYADQQFKAMIDTYWDCRHGGGVLWQEGKPYKASISNELFLYLLTLMCQAKDDNKDYKEWIEYSWEWIKKKLIKGKAQPEGTIQDGVYYNKNAEGATWTYNQGVILGALANLYLMEKDESLRNEYLTEAKKIANTMKIQEGGESVSKMVNEHGILHEIKYPKMDDQNRRSFKGIFMRHLAYLASVLPEEDPDRKGYIEIITKSAIKVRDKAKESGGKINAYWYDTDRVPVYDTASQSSGTDLMNAMVQCRLVSGKSDWSYQRVLPNVGTGTSPAICEFNGKLYAVWKGTGDNRLWFASMDDPNGSWTPQHTISNAETTESPALAVFNGRLYCVFKGVGRDAEISYVCNDGDDNWSGKRTVSDGGSGVTPSLAVFENRLYCAWKGAKDSRLWYATMDTDESWTGQYYMGNDPVTQDSPELTVLGGRLYCFWKENERLCYRYKTEGRDWVGSWKVDNVKLRSVPTFSEFGGQGRGVYRNTEGKIGMITVTDCGGNEEFHDGNLFFMGTSRRPAIGIFQNQTYVFWSGASHRDADNICYIHTSLEKRISF
ncbi:glycoside hydrolase family 76 protein [Fulvitalea axinellae]